MFSSRKLGGDARLGEKPSPRHCNDLNLCRGPGCQREIRPAADRFVSYFDKSSSANDPPRLRAPGKKGKPLNRVTRGKRKCKTSVKACAAADGSFSLPLITFEEAAVQSQSEQEHTNKTGMTL